MNKLKNIGIRAKIDDSEKSPGYKFSEQEMLGIPIRIELGPKDIENGECVVVRRNDREKITVKLKDLEKEIPIILDNIQKNMFNTAKEFLDKHIYKVKTIDEMIEICNKNIGFVKAMWCGSEKCEDEIKYATGGYGSRCIDKDHEHIDDKCIFCGRDYLL